MARQEFRPDPSRILNRVLNSAKSHELQRIQERLAREEAECLKIFRLHDLGQGTESPTEAEQQHLQHCVRCDRLLEQAQASHQQRLPRPWLEQAGDQLVALWQPPPTRQLHWVDPDELIGRSGNGQLEIEWLPFQSMSHAELEIRTSSPEVANMLIGVRMIPTDVADQDAISVLFTPLEPDDDGGGLIRLGIPYAEMMPIRGGIRGILAAPAPWSELQAIDRKDLIQSIRDCPSDSPTDRAWQSWARKRLTLADAPVSFREEIRRYFPECG
ncbi:hypothetical protein [Tuwongella immobilis]|uniref:Uncharacterized protein n=1 Tax=Tuwongella immobilis TaxID=692036 RepID=A0A6C2YJ87_9BACT|nr:hypothetical protein [Tuwongella immobilis]VIP01165.1 unnamed protein product [Tuwongella immobilis]VTR97756.1 unnamed protein product [Tuwongella immobilis]